jgi:hypothetical protein
MDGDWLWVSLWDYQLVRVVGCHAVVGCRFVKGGREGEASSCSAWVYIMVVSAAVAVQFLLLPSLTSVVGFLLAGPVDRSNACLETFDFDSDFEFGLPTPTPHGALAQYPSTITLR